MNQTDSDPASTTIQTIVQPGWVLRELLLSGTMQRLLDSFVIAAGIPLALAIRFDGTLPQAQLSHIGYPLVLFLVAYLGCNQVFRVYRIVWRFTGLTDSLRIGFSVLAAALVLLMINAGSPYGHLPLGVMVIHPMLTYTGFLALRVLRRVSCGLRPRRSVFESSPKGRTRVLLHGAGQVGIHLVLELGEHKDRQIVGFLDDDRRLRGRVIQGLPVLGTSDELEDIVRRWKVDEVILCDPQAPRPKIQKLAAACRQIPVKVLTVPALSEIVEGRIVISQLRPVRMEDLLTRISVEYPSDHELSRTYQDRRILITGAAGSIGSEIVRQLTDFTPSQLILLDKDENGLFEIALELRESFDNVLEMVSDIRDRKRLEQVFSQTRPEVVFHAAAYKHVPLMEFHPSEAILNNVVGTRNLIDVSAAFGVKHFVLISTDKAVNPSSIMGASKRIAELSVQLHAAAKGGTRFCCVRFGNVLGSRGSVVPIFQRQISEGHNITVTHPEVRRYFMTIPEASRLVIQAGSLGRNGEIFLLDMGDPVKIVDLARNLIRLSGLVPDRDVRIEFTGLRPGEKLDEELLLRTEDGIRVTKYPRIFVATSSIPSPTAFRTRVIDLAEAARAHNTVRIKEILLAMEIGYGEGVQEPLHLPDAERLLALT
ncbi:MAG: polysaccharide biosynthesis protein [Acidobacteria bacterium]|nr:MAG: polysaccharide biosynthesis protein [Acidobacteriota bacterium]